MQEEMRDFLVRRLLSSLILITIFGFLFLDLYMLAKFEYIEGGLFEVISLSALVSAIISVFIRTIPGVTSMIALAYSGVVLYFLQMSINDGLSVNYMEILPSLLLACIIAVLIDTAFERSSAHKGGVAIICSLQFVLFSSVAFGATLI